MAVHEWNFISLRNTQKHATEFADALQKAEKEGWEVFETQVRYEGANFVWSAWLRKPKK